MPISPAIFASAGKIISGSFRLTLKVTSNNSVVYQSDSLTTMMSFLTAYSTANNITVPMTLMFNTSYTYAITTTLAFNFINNGNLFTVKSASGVYPVIDGGNSIPTILNNSMSNFIWDGIDCINADITDIAGCIVRNSAGTINTTYQNFKFKRGYCAMRATGTQDGSGNTIAIIENHTVKNCVIEDVINGSFRFGNGDNPEISATTNFSLRTTGYYDMRNILIQDITLVDNFNKGVITGQATGFMGMLILKKTDGLTVTNFVCNNTSESLFQIESSTNIVVNKMLVENFGCRGLTNQQGMNIKNSNNIICRNIFMRPNNDGVNKTILNFNNCKNLELYHNTCIYINTGDIPFSSNDLSLVKMNGNVFKSTSSQNPCNIVFTRLNGYTPSIAQDLLVEDNNVFCSAGNFNVNLKITDHLTTPVSVNVSVRTNSGTNIITPATYRSTYSLGANTLFPITTAVAVSTRTNPNATTSLAFYLNDGTSGRNLVASTIGGVTIDAFGFIRIYPTDAGACDRDAVVLA